MLTVQCALYWTRCKSPSVSFDFCSILSDFLAAWFTDLPAINATVFSTISSIMIFILWDFLYTLVGDFVLQGVSHWNVSFRLSLTDRNMQVRFCLNMFFSILRLDIFRHYNHFLWNAYCAPSIGPDVNHPQFHLVFAQLFCCYSTSVWCTSEK